jgi:hypothetical protein
MLMSLNILSAFLELVRSSLSVVIFIALEEEYSQFLDLALKIVNS